MIAVIFEVFPAPGQKDAYLSMAQSLRTLLEEEEGFISVERFQSITNPDKMLSVSFFKDEASVKRWRTRIEHRQAQAAGKSQLFSDYRLRVCEVLRDYSPTQREQAPVDD